MTAPSRLLALFADPASEFRRNEKKQAEQAPEHQ